MTAKQLLPFISESVHRGLPCVRKVVHPGSVQVTPDSWGQISLLQPHSVKGSGSSRVTLAANTSLAVLGSLLRHLFLMTVFLCRLCRMHSQSQSVCSQYRGFWSWLVLRHCHTLCNI